MKHSQALEALKASAKHENDELKRTIIKLHEETLDEIEMYIKNIYKEELQKLERLIRQSHRILKQEIRTPWWRRIIMTMKGEE